MGVAILKSKSNNLLNIKQRSYSTSEESISSASSDKRLNKKPIIDVWWLSDDGGLTLLVPYLLTQQGSRLKVMEPNLRVFTVAPEGVSVTAEEERMAALLEKFRIHYSYLHVVPALTEPNQEIIEKFFKMLEPFLGENKEGQISEEELTRMHNRIVRHIQTGILLRSFSCNADLVVV
ncbi:hypothetical protein COOONC_13882 [Cooperia oncophora]